jgi:tripartite-type tricarboxylate transporter receptor subunit TctC
MFAMPLAAPALAQEGRPIRLLVGFPPGGGVDLLARVLGERLGPLLGTHVVIENRPGQAAGLATEMGARAAPDGQTLLMANIGTTTINPHLYRPYVDTVRDLTPIARLVTYNVVAFAPAQMGWSGLPDLLAAARARPDALNYGSAGQGGITHVAAELLLRAGRARMTHVPYRGSAPAMTDLAAGRIQLQTDIWGVGEAMVQSGRVRALASSGEARSALHPDVPTAHEQGVDFVLEGWQCLVGPAGLPPPFVQRVNAALLRVLAEPDVAARLRAQGNLPAPSSPEELGALILNERQRMGRVIAEAGIRAE